MKYNFLKTERIFNPVIFLQKPLRIYCGAIKIFLKITLFSSTVKFMDNWERSSISNKFIKPLGKLIKKDNKTKTCIKIHHKIEYNWSLQILFAPKEGRKRLQIVLWEIPFPLSQCLIYKSQK